MLKLLLPLTLTLFLLTPPYWRTLPMITFMLSTLSSSLCLPFSSTFTLNSLFFTDHLSSTLMTLTLWVCALTLPISLLPLLRSHAPLSLPLLNSLLIITLILAFSFNNLIYFYVAFETSLIPTLFMILLWGYQPDRLQASFYMIMYTVSASLPLLFSIIILGSQTHSLTLLFINSTPPSSIPPHLWWALCILAFLVKLPLYSLHLWLPKAHVEAPTAGSMILASILLKLGGYGLIRFTSISQQMMYSSAPILLSISLSGAVLTGLICLRQTDLKALIAYSSVAHMALVVAGISSLSIWGWSGALAMMLAHGLSSPSMFSLAGITYETTTTRSLFLTKGLLSLLPNTCMWWFIATTANMAGPPSINLLAEILLLTSILSKSLLLTPFIFLSTLLAAAYSLHLYTSTQHGPPPKFLNPTQPPLVTHNTSLLLLLSPLFLLILKPEMISSWV